MLFRRRLAKSFLCAFQGLRYAWKHEQNFRIEIAVAVAAFLAGFALGLSPWEWTVLVLVISLVLMLELLNSSIEALADLVKPRLHEYVELIKDVMAGAVLVVSIAAAVIGFLIFIPHFIKLGNSLTQISNVKTQNQQEFSIFNYQFSINV